MMGRWCTRLRHPADFQGMGTLTFEVVVRICRINLAYQPHPNLATLLKTYPTLVQWGSALAAAGCQVEVLQFFSHSQALDLSGVRYRSFELPGCPPSWRWWYPPLPLMALLRESPPDVIHLSGLHYAGLIPHLRFASPHSLIVVQDHGEKPRPPSLRLWVRGQLLSQADALFFHAREAGEMLRLRGQTGKAPIYEIPEASSDLSPWQRTIARQHLGLGDEPVVLWVGRLEAVKDPSTSFMAFCRLWQENPQVRLYVIYQSAQLEQQLRHLVEREGATRAVTWVGSQNREQLGHWFSAADTFITSSPWEGSNYALIEAISCGLWPVASDIPPHRTLLRGGQYGGLFAVGDISACRNTLAAALRRDTHITRPAQLHYFEEELSWGAVARRTLQVYGELTPGRGTTPGA